MSSTFLPSSASNERFKANAIFVLVRTSTRTSCLKYTQTITGLCQCLMTSTILWRICQKISHWRVWRQWRGTPTHSKRTTTSPQRRCDKDTWEGGMWTYQAFPSQLAYAHRSHLPSCPRRCLLCRLPVRSRRVLPHRRQHLPGLERRHHRLRPLDSKAALPHLHRVARRLLRSLPVSKDFFHRHHHHQVARRRLLGWHLRENCHLHQVARRLHHHRLLRHQKQTLLRRRWSLKPRDLLPARHHHRRAT
mmetsp:Transcript_56766/g.65041  ORF Transcript_56766/g.65041 Transcript_56766/m.65041 type:complete len:248 (-) Transcript_56766:261-1004(-)